MGLADPKISLEYCDLLAKMHRQAPWGTKGYTYIPDFLPFCRELACTTVLDYGAGWGTLERDLAKLAPDLQVHSYDPAMPKGCENIQISPFVKEADFLVCTDVLEHVEFEFLDAVLEEIYRNMLKGGYLSIGLVLAKRVLPDGRNAHILLKPGEWWLEKLEAMNWSLVKHNLGLKSLRIWLRK